MTLGLMLSTIRFAAKRRAFSTAATVDGLVGAIGNTPLVRFFAF